MPNFRPLAPFLHVEKFALGGVWWVGVKTWILVIRFKPKLNNKLSLGIHFFQD